MIGRRTLESLVSNLIVVLFEIGETSVEVSLVFMAFCGTFLAGAYN